MEEHDKLNTIERFQTLFSETIELNWTWEFGKQIPFLDLKISLGKSFHTKLELDYMLYEKPTNTGQLTDPSSNYPDVYLYSWIKGECIRITRNCKLERDFNIMLSKFKNNLQDHGYPDNIINKYCNVSFSNRGIELLKKKNSFQQKKKFIGIAHENGGQLVQEKINELLKTSNENGFNVILHKGKSLQEITNKTVKAIYSSDLS
jgi:hypothetical protein